MEGYLLSIDCGTQSFRVLVFNPKGELLAKTQIEYEPYFSVNPGWAEQDPEIYWQSLCTGCNRLKADNPALFSRIEGVGVTTQRMSMVNVDQEGNPLRPAILWLDQRKTSAVHSPNCLIRLALSAVGMKGFFYKIQADGKCNWIMQHQPEIWEKTYKYLQISGFLNLRLTGNFLDSAASQVGHLPFNYKKMEWDTKRGLSCMLFPIEREKLPDLLKPGGLIGKITKEASTQTGISEGIPVIACGSDKGCETIGMGVLNQKMASLSFGTTATVQTTANKYFEPVRFKPPYPGSIPDHYHPEIEIFRGYWMISWFKNEFAYKEVMKAKEMGVPTEQVLDRLLGKAPVGSMGLMVQPYWGPLFRGPAAKGAIIGFGDVHKKAHVYRAIIEGLGYGMLDGLRKLEKAGKVRVERLAVSGGASQSDQICQISADIFNLPLVRGKTHETSGLGAAILTAVGLGVYPSFERAIKEMVHHEKYFKPESKNVSIYRELYGRVYRKMYDSLKPLYEEIRDITGYPEK